MKNNSSFDNGKVKRIEKAVIEQKATDDLLNSPAFPSLLKKAQETYQQRKKEEEAGLREPLESPFDHCVTADLNRAVLSTVTNLLLEKEEKLFELYKAGDIAADDLCFGCLELVDVAAACKGELNQFITNTYTHCKDMVQQEIPLLKILNQTTARLAEDSLSEIERKLPGGIADN